MEPSLWFKHRAWIPLTWALAAVNLAAIWFAARPGEPWHATGHGLAAVLLSLGATRLMARRRSGLTASDLQQALDQNEYQQQTIDGMQGRLQELEERLDFTERPLARHRDATKQ